MRVPRERYTFLSSAMKVIPIGCLAIFCILFQIYKTEKCPKLFFFCQKLQFVNWPSEKLSECEAKYSLALPDLEMNFFNSSF